VVLFWCGVVECGVGGGVVVRVDGGGGGGVGCPLDPLDLVIIVPASLLSFYICTFPAITLPSQSLQIEK